MSKRSLPSACALLVLAALYFALAASGPDARGYWQDDGIYLATARSLADSGGYRHAELPGQPYQTKYPVLYPALLAGCLRAWPDPRSPLLPGALAAAAFVVLAVRYLRSVLAVPRGPALAAGLLAAVSPSIVSLVRFTLTDLVYGCLSVVALLCVDGEASTPRRRRTLLLAGSVATAAAMMTRAVGISLAVALVLALLLRRRRIDALWASVVIGVAMAPWWLWQAWADAHNGAQTIPLLLRQDLGYSLWLPHAASDVARTAWQNLVRIGFGLARYELALPEGVFSGAMADGSWPAVLAHGAAALSLAVVALGYAATARRGLRTVHCYLAAYGALILAWPFEPFRFLAALTPFLLAFALVGVVRIGEWIGRRPAAGTVAGAAAAVALLVLFASEDVRIAASTTEAFRVAGRTTSALAEDDATAEFVRRFTAPDDVIASALPARLFLLTGRRGVPLWHDDDPYPIYCGTERTWRRFYLDGDSESFVRRQMDAGLVRAYREAGVRYLLLSRETAPAALVGFVAEHPERFRARWGSRLGTRRLYEFTSAVP